MMACQVSRLQINFTSFKDTEVKWTWNVDIQRLNLARYAEFF